MTETIAAIATAYGEGGIGIIRISGEKSLPILKEIFEFNNEQGNFINRKLTYGKIINRDTGKFIDEALVVYMKAPGTYTAEDVVEINCHGSVVSLKNTLELVLEKGARLAEPGEFTKRAFLNGRLDLSQAEAVIDVVKAKTDKSFEIALSQLEGSLSSKIDDIRKLILDTLVDITVNIDYPDEDIEELTYEKLNKDILLINDLLKKLLNSSDTGRMLKEGISISIVGKPNVGKSSLMNGLLKESRAIVTDIPGTTRDTIEEHISIKGIPVNLIDTAGIRETDDTVEKIGIEKSKEAFNKADFIIFILDCSKKLSDEDLYIADYIDERKALVLLNKIDLGEETNYEYIKSILPNCDIIKTSLINDNGIQEIENYIVDMVYSGDIKQNDSVLISNTRHIDLLKKASRSLEDAHNMVNAGEALDFIEIDIKSSYDYLGEIIGETVSDDIINEVFSRFCLGK